MSIQAAGDTDPIDPLMKWLVDAVATADFSSLSWSQLGIRAMAFILVVALILKGLQISVEVLAKLVEDSRKLGVPLVLDADERLRIRRRAQFCKVLTVDLSAIAKAENWNDQFFTDLEAEVEAEGAYYGSRLRRLCKRQSRGRRRTGSLIGALESSTEQSLLLVGEPGSGKSIAVRHLAAQYAVRAQNSTNPRAVIPLYVNLKEFPAAELKDLTATFVKQFVLDHVRRGDADTAAYIAENWERYKSEGSWLFLFDSFDEIPAVLHAPAGSEVIAQHAAALAHFLAGVAPCRGMIASREYKGPDALPWTRFRILPLSRKRQLQLIHNAFLTRSQRSLAREHTVCYQGVIYQNPLFLALLCRYIKVENKAPKNDHAMLLQHIEGLASREPDYIYRRYALRPGDLLEGARKVAVRLALDPALGLAPTQSEVLRSLESDRVPAAEAERLLNALIEVKIGRVDVKESVPGERRFTFSHRRYQESLFVEYLARGTAPLGAYELLHDSRWREYVVTLIQTQENAVIAPLVTVAVAAIEAASASVSSRVTHYVENVGDVSFFRWSMRQMPAAIATLEEGFFSRSSDIPPELHAAVDELLSGPLSGGDEFDRITALAHGRLMSRDKLVEALIDALRNGSSESFRPCVMALAYLQHAPAPLQVLARRPLSEFVLEAKNEGELNTFESIALRCPPEIRAARVYARSKRARTLLRIAALLAGLLRLYVLFPYLALKGLGRRGRRQPDDDVWKIRVTARPAALGLLLAWSVGWLFVNIIYENLIFAFIPDGRWTFIALLCLVMTFYGLFLYPFFCAPFVVIRECGLPIYSTGFWVREVGGKALVFSRDFSRNVLARYGFGGLCGLSGAMFAWYHISGHLLPSSSEELAQLTQIAAAASFGLVAAGSVQLAFRTLRKRSRLKEFELAVANATEEIWSMVLRRGRGGRIALWLRHFPDIICPTRASCRFLLSGLRHHPVATRVFAQDTLQLLAGEAIPSNEARRGITADLMNRAFGPVSDERLEQQAAPRESVTALRPSA
jgi:hypothetical protein